MFERIKALNVKGKIALQEAQTELALMGQIGKIAEGNAILPEKDEESWIKLGGASLKELDQSDQETLREQSIKAYYKNPHGRNIFRLFEKYVAGHGFGIQPMSTIPAVKEYWDKFWKENKMAFKKKEVVRRSMRDGECFIKYFPATTAEEIMQIRFLNPEFIKDPDKPPQGTKIKDGIEIDPDDVENVKAYWYNNVRYASEEVLHIKIMVDSDVLRGRSFIEPILPVLAWYQKWQTDRIKLNEIRNTMALIKHVKGNPTQAANISKNYETSRTLNADGTTKARAPEGVSVYTANSGVEYELKTPNLQAADVQHDGRALLLTQAAGAGLPEFMVTSDASNANYASTMVAEGPAVMEFEDWQDFFAEAFKEIYYRVIENGTEVNALPVSETITTEEVLPTGEIKEGTETVPISTDCSITFPDLVSRDIKKETEAYVMQVNALWMSNQTAQAKLDLNTEEEDELIKKWDREHPEEEEEDFQKTKEDLEIERQRKQMEEE